MLKNRIAKSLFSLSVGAIALQIGYVTGIKFPGIFRNIHYLLEIIIMSSILLFFGFFLL
jgi:hypothetical protein